jgi:hypothetical protein
MDVITTHRLCLLDLDPASMAARSLLERVHAVYARFLERLPYENLSRNRVCRDRPHEPDQWPRATDRVLKDNRTCGLGGDSFALAYALRDLLRGVGANAHCTYGRNLVTEETHAAVLVYGFEEPLLLDPGFLLGGPLEVRPGATLDEPLGRVTLRAGESPSLTVCLRQAGATEERSLYTLVPLPAPPQAYRQAWLASFWRGRILPLSLARRTGDEIRRYREHSGVLEVLTPRGTRQHALKPRDAESLHALFGISRDCLEAWFCA